MEFSNLSANIGNFVGQEKKCPRKPLKTEAKYLRILCFECAKMAKFMFFDWSSNGIYIGVSP